LRQKEADKKRHKDRVTNIETGLKKNRGHLKTKTIT